MNQPGAPPLLRLLPILLVLGAAVATYANTWNNVLVFDDAKLIPTLQAFQDPWDGRALFLEPHWGDSALFRPFSSWTIAANVALNRLLGLPGEQAPLFRIVNLLLHAAVCLLLFHWLAAIRCPRWAMLTALLFAVHPIHTEAVASVTGRAELLAACGGLGFLILHRHGRTAPAALLLGLALCSKESAIVFPALALLSDRIIPPRGKARGYLPYLTYGAVVLAFLGWRQSVVQPHAIPLLDNPLAHASLSRRMATAGAVQLDYLRLQLWPLQLSSDYSYNQIPRIGPLDLRSLAAVFLFAATVGLGWWTQKRWPIAWFCLLAYLVAVLPTSNVLFPVGTIMAERLIYVPSIFVLAGVAWAVMLLRRRSTRLADLFIVVLLLVLGGRSMARNATWSTPLDFYRAQIISAPESARAHFGMGFALARNGNDVQSLESYGRALEIYPAYAEAHFNRANALRRTGAGTDAVISGYRETLRHAPEHPGALFNLARLLIETGQRSAAEELLERISALDPPHPALERLRERLARTVEIVTPESGSTIGLPEN